ncbi:uncharacterized protein LOC100118798 isoform X1 [Nasonia vitripennis]|uniref:Protein chico n=2 Tax=Nasonia vitripennis TaxID=7425 RepID=A0A7M7LJ69_NASVI|nr:uncharacterized protein LOC100118798 isoform X1 [Nasonia vitripennis]
MVDNNCIIEGNVKFRDGKKWKSRWCVMRKLSPVADCLHLQLYGDSKDRYKQAQTKASLSLEHFLGVQSGFTLDKESNTIAIICQDVTVVLAFDTRERLMQWQVKISNNLGEDQEFLVLISSVPAKAKLSTGPAHLHVQEQRFCMTAGLPPRLLGIWQIGQLRRYGVVEGRFCFEAGSRCARGEGLHVLISEHAHEIERALQFAAEGKLSTRPRRRPGLSSTISGSVAPIPNLASELLRPDLDQSISTTSSSSSSYWSSLESRHQTSTPSSSLALAPTPASSAIPTSESSDCDGVMKQQHACLDRCSSCISKLGAMSKSSTTVSSQLQPRATPFDRLSLSSYSSSSHDSDYSGCSPQPVQVQSQPAPAPAACPSPLTLPPRPPLKPPSTAKPPMPLPSCSCNTVRRSAASVGSIGSISSSNCYDNYDVPKAIGQLPATIEPQQQQQYYDTPRKIKECLTTQPVVYPNYDTPHLPQAVRLQQCGCPAKLNKSLASCPCHNVMSWAGFVLPYCRRGAGVELHTVQPVRLSGEGKMPVVNSASGQLSIYNNCNSSSTNITEASQNECPLHPSTESANSSLQSNYENVEPVIDTQPEPAAKPVNNYVNIDFTESLGNYENSKDLLSKIATNNLGEQRAADQFTQSSQEQTSSEVASTATDSEHENTEGKETPSSVCQKCGHFKGSSQDYLIVDEEEELIKKKKPVPGYLPMQPAHNACSKEVLSRLCTGIKSSSNPALSASSSGLESNRKRSESEYRVPGSAMLSSPYFRRRLLEISSSETGASLNMLLRKRSYSAESAHYLDDEKNSFTPAVPIHKCPSDTDKVLASRQLSANSVDIQVNQISSDTLSPQATLSSIKIRRSSSVPSKTGHNRDSSSSNDSGVSTGSLSHRTAEFVEFESPTTANSLLMKKQSVPLMYRKSPPPACFHSSLPRKSKSTDPLRELTFQFHKVKLPTKSSSAEADIPTCLPPKVHKEFSSPSEVTTAPYIDSRSTSSGTSDMSDYIETLSLSSHSSSDAPDNLRIGGRAVTTTLRPRSGKEYYKIDRSILVEQGRTISTSSNCANVTPLVRKETLRHPVT